MKTEQTFFTLAETADRLSCHPDDVLRYGVLRGLGMVTHIHRATLKELVCRVSGGEIVACGANRAEPVYASGHYFRIRSDDLRAIEFDGSVTPETLYLPDSVSGEKTDGMLVYQIESGAKAITANNLRVLSSELERWTKTNSQNDQSAQAGTKGRMDKLPHKTPAFLFGEGFNEEARKITTITKYLELDTWTPIEAAMLVSGLQPPMDCKAIPDGAMKLDNSIAMPNEDSFHEARRVLKLWNSQLDAPQKILPLDFIAWCKTKGVDTSWLRSIEQSRGLPTDRPAAKRTAGRPKDPAALANRLDELKLDAINEAKQQRVQGKTATVDSVASALACSDNWCQFERETLKSAIRAKWWK